MNHGGGTVSAPGAAATNSDETRIVLRAPAVRSPVPESLIQRLLALPAVAGVDRYVTGQLAEGTTVVGMDPPGAVLLGADGNVLAAPLVTGRSLGAGEPNQPGVVVRRGWARSHKTVFGYEVDQMVEPSHAPLVQLSGGTVNVLGIVATGNDRGDQSVFAPLPPGRADPRTEGAPSGTPPPPSPPSPPSPPWPPWPPPPSCCSPWPWSCTSARKRSACSRPWVPPEARSSAVLAESVTFALIGGAAGVALFGLVGTRLGALLLPRAAASLPSMTFTGGENAVSTLGLDLSLTDPLAALALGLAVVVGLAGSVYPLLRSLRLAPVEALRHDRRSRS